MAKVHFVKSARKDNPVAKKGESYYWWKPMVGGRGGAKRYSKERPKPSQLTQSSFLSTLYGIQEQLSEAKDVETLRSLEQGLRDLGEETQGSYDNMPEGLQQGDTGQMLEERATQCEEWADEFDTACTDLESAIEARTELRQEWSDYDEQAEVDESDGEDAPEEPSDERPPEDDDDLVDEARDAIEGACPF